MAALNKTELLDVLSSALDQALKARISSKEIGIPEALNSSDIDVLVKASLYLHDFEESIRKAAESDTRFSCYSVKMLRYDGGAVGFYPCFSGQLLLRRALDTKSPEAAIEWFLKVLSTPSATGVKIQTLWGVPVSGEIQLTSEIKIVPIENIPDCPEKESLTKPRYDRSLSSLVTMLDFSPPKSALLAKRIINPLLAHPDDVTPQGGTIDDLLNDIILVLSVVGPRCTIPAVSWFSFDDKDLQEARFGVSRGAKIIEVVPLGHLDYPVLEPEEAKQIVKSFLDLDAKLRTIIKYALHRFNQALRRHNPGDRAVELAIAFESLLGDGQQNEVTHKVKVRTVRLLGGDINNRIENSKIIKRVYDLRSRVVHTGNATISDGDPDIICKATIICADIIKKVIRQGSIPIWGEFDIAE